MITNNVQNNTQSFKGVFKVCDPKFDSHAGQFRNKVLNIGCIHYQPDGLYVTCGDRRDSLMIKTLKELGVKFRHRKFRSDSYLAGTLNKYFEKKK